MTVIFFRLGRIEPYLLLVLRFFVGNPLVGLFSGNMFKRNLKNSLQFTLNANKNTILYLKMLKKTRCLL